MASISESSIRDWLQFDGKEVPINPCQYVNYTGHLDYVSDGVGLIDSQPTYTDVDCKQICNDSASLFAPHTNNLVTCGLWSTMLSAYTTFGPNDSLQSNDNEESSDIFQRFEEVGLTLNLLDYSLSYADSISSCLQVLYYNSKFFTYADDGTTVAACTREVLFPLGSNTNATFPAITALQTCIDALCSPITLNPDLAGVGVISSFLIQSGVAIIALITLGSFEWFPSKKGAPSLHAAIIAALVDFHKVQCFFASTIQITALLLFKDSYTNSAKNTFTIGSDYHDFFDTSILIVLASSGFIPVSLTIACISRYGRQSWYLLALSFITMALSTATLATSNLYANAYGVPFELYRSNMNNPYLYNNNNYNSMNTTSTTCNAKGSVGHSLDPLCGSSQLRNNAIGSEIVLSPWIWAVWVNCILWLLACVMVHWLRLDKRRCPRLRKVFATWSNPLHTDHRGTRGLWVLLSGAAWLPSFCGQYYLFGAYFAGDLISRQWSFGQIIAVTVWVPSVVEYGYTQYNGVVEASKYRYPAPLHLTTTSESASESEIQLWPKRVERLDTGVTLVEGWDGERREGEYVIGGTRKDGLRKGGGGSGMEGGKEEGEMIRRLKRVRTAESARTHPDCLRCYLERKGF